MWNLELLLKTLHTRTPLATVPSPPGGIGMEPGKGKGDGTETTTIIPCTLLSELHTCLVAQMLLSYILQESLKRLR